MESHTQLLVDSFDKFISDRENPKRAKLAKYDYQMVRLQNPEMWSNVVEKYIEILKDINFNNDIDLFQLKKILELPVLKGYAKYDELFELLINLLGKQSQNIESSQLLLNRGDDYLDGDIYKAIKFYSRALTKLFHESSKVDLIKTLIKLGAAFQQIGLLWGARSYYVRAFMESINLYFNEGNVIPGLFLSMRSLKYLELRLGRINHSLQFNELELIGLNLYPYETDDEKESERYLQYDGLLAIALLNLKQSAIEQLEMLPDHLSKNELIMSSAALKYMLGYYDEDCVQAMGSKEALDAFMKKLFEQPPSDEFQKLLDTNFLSDEVTLKTKIIGCDVIVNTRRDNLHQELGATLLAMLENMFATSISDQIIPMLSEFVINIVEVKANQFDIQVTKQDNTIRMAISNIKELIEHKNRGLILEKLNIVLAIFTTQIVPLSTELEKIKKSIEEENAMFRSINCSNTLDTFVVHEGDIFFMNKVTTGMKVYKNIREKSIFQDDKLENQEEHENVESIKEVKYEELPEGIDFSKVHHDKIKISDIIYLPLWDEAKWEGLCVWTDGEFEHPPIVGLVFGKKEGLDIFRKWKAESKTNKITIGIITGIDKNNPYWYRVIIGENIIGMNPNEESKPTIINHINRLHTMEAKNDFNMSLLKQAITKHKTFKFIPILKEDLKFQRLRNELAFNKKSESIIIKDVSEINEKDAFLISGITPFDKPVNNTGKELFVEKLIKRKQKMSRNSDKRGC